MPNSYTKLYLHLIFAPKGRFSIHSKEHRVAILNYISGIITNHKSHLIIGSVMPDHVHLLIALHPTLSVSEIAQKVKSNSSKHINEQTWLPGKFSWSDGYGGFTVSQSKLDVVKQYIENQEEHHKKHKFYDEMKEFFAAHNIITDKEEGCWADKQEQEV